VADLYDPQTYVNGPGGGTPLSASRLNHTEQGIDGLDDAVQEIADDVDAIRAALSQNTGGRVPVVTTAQRALLAVADGDQVWDTDVDALLTFAGSKWQKADGTDVTAAGGSNAPTSMTAEVVDGGTIGAIELSWTAPAAADGDDTYKLYETASPSGVSGATALTTTSSTRTPSTARTYEYWVTCSIDGTESAASNHVFATLPYVEGGGGGSGSGSPAELLNINGLGTGTGGWWNIGVGRPSAHVNIEPNQLKTFSEVPYCYINGSKVHFEATCDGARTSDKTKYPRSELREYKNATTKAAWSGSSGTHRMVADITVTSLDVNTKRELCIFQMHDENDDTLQVIAKAPDGSTTQSWVLKVNGSQVATLGTGIALGDEHELDCTVTNGNLVFKYDGTTKYSANPGWGSGQYFKIGAYLQANNRDQANDAKDKMACEIRNLLVTHSPAL
jgi:hypothetical protein